MPNKVDVTIINSPTYPLSFKDIEDEPGLYVCNHSNEDRFLLITAKRQLIYVRAGELEVVGSEHAWHKAAFRAFEGKITITLSNF